MRLTPLRVFAYVCLVFVYVNAYRTATATGTRHVRCSSWCWCWFGIVAEVGLTDPLINFYAIAVVVFVVVSARQCLLWYGEWYCGQCHPATIATIPKVTTWFISQREYPLLYYI